MKRQPSLLSVAHNLPSSSFSATIIHSPNRLGKKYKPLTRDSIIPDASVSTTYIRRGKGRKKWKKGKGCERERRGVKLTTMPEWQDRKKPGKGSIQVPVGAGVRRRIFGVSNVSLGGQNVIPDHGQSGWTMIWKIKKLSQADLRS